MQETATVERNLGGRPPGPGPVDKPYGVRVIDDGWLDGPDRRYTEEFEKLERIVLAFLHSHWDQGIEVTIGGLSRGFKFHPWIPDALNMLEASRDLHVRRKGERSLLLRGWSGPVTTAVAATD